MSESEEKKLEPVKESELSEEKKERVVDGNDEAASVNDRGVTFATEVTGPHGAGTVKGVNDRAATGTADSAQERDANDEAVSGAELGDKTYGDTTPVGERSNKKNVEHQFDPTGDRFTSKKASFKSTEAPLDIYPQDARRFAEPGVEEERNPDILEGGVVSPRDMDALMQASRLNREDMVKAVRVMVSNPHGGPDGPMDFKGTPLQKPTDPEEAIGESRVAFPPAEFDTNRLNSQLPPSGPARGQKEAEEEAERLKRNAREAFGTLDKE